MPVADVAVETFLRDDVAHIVEDLDPGRDRGARPRFEAITEGIKVAVRPRARVAVREPRTAKAFLRFEHDKARTGALLGEMIRPADPRDAGPYDGDVEVLGPWCLGAGAGCGLGHRVLSRLFVELTDEFAGQA